MRVFIDACIDPRAARLFPEHEVKTAFDLGWHNLADPSVLKLADEAFDVFLTADQGFEFEHNLKNLRTGIVIVHVARNKVDFYQAVLDGLRSAIMSVKPGEVVHVRP